MRDVFVKQVHGLFAFATVQVVQSCQIIAVIGAIFSSGTVNSLKGGNNFAVVVNGKFVFFKGLVIQGPLFDFKWDFLLQGSGGQIQFKSGRLTPEVCFTGTAVSTGVASLFKPFTKTIIGDYLNDGRFARAIADFIFIKLTLTSSPDGRLRDWGLPALLFLKLKRLISVLIAN